MKEIALSLLPIVLFFAVFQALILKLSGRNLTRILIGLVYTYIGLVLFLTGVNVGFMPAGNYLGQVLAGLSHPWVIVPIAMVMGYFIVKAEPAVYVLNKQVEEITDGAIPALSLIHILKKACENFELETKRGNANQVAQADVEPGSYTHLG